MPLLTSLLHVGHGTAAVRNGCAQARQQQQCPQGIMIMLAGADQHTMQSSELSPADFGGFLCARLLLRDGLLLPCPEHPLTEAASRSCSRSSRLALTPLDSKGSGQCCCRSVGTPASTELACRAAGTAADTCTGPCAGLRASAEIWKDGTSATEQAVWSSAAAAVDTGTELPCCLQSAVICTGWAAPTPLSASSACCACRVLHVSPVHLMESAEMLPCTMIMQDRCHSLPLSSVTLHCPHSTSLHFVSPSCFLQTVRSSSGQAINISPSQAQQPTCLRCFWRAFFSLSLCLARCAESAAACSSCSNLAAASSAALAAA